MFTIRWIVMGIKVKIKQAKMSLISCLLYEKQKCHFTYLSLVLSQSNCRHADKSFVSFGVWSPKFTKIQWQLLIGVAMSWLRPRSVSYFHEFKYFSLLQFELWGKNFQLGGFRIPPHTSTSNTRRPISFPIYAPTSHVLPAQWNWKSFTNPQICLCLVRERCSTS